MHIKMDINLLGDTFTDELHTDLGSAAFRLNHDWFIDLVINTATGGGGTQLVINTDYTVLIEDTKLSARVTEAKGESKNVWGKVQIINATYQTGDLYFSGKYIADSVEGKDVNGVVPIGVPIPWHKSLVAQGSTALKTGTATSYVANKLVDSGGGFSGVVNIGDIIWNSTDSVFATVTAIDGDTQLSLDWDAFDTGNEGYSIYDEPELPESWLECDGSVVADADSPLDGLTIPDLNGDGRFIRGGSTAGIDQTDAFQGHYHEGAHKDPNGKWGTSATTYTQKLTVQAEAAEGVYKVGPAITDGVNGAPKTASETRSINMSAIMIMRIK